MIFNKYLYLEMYKATLHSVKFHKVTFLQFKDTFIMNLEGSYGISLFRGKLWYIFFVK